MSSLRSTRNVRKQQNDVSLFKLKKKDFNLPHVNMGDSNRVIESAMVEYFVTNYFLTVRDPNVNNASHIQRVREKNQKSTL